MTNEKAEVKDNKEQPRPVSTCFEGLPSAEMIQKIMGEYEFKGQHFNENVWCEKWKTWR